MTAGYVDQAEQTARSFLPDPYGEGVMYRTGDLVRALASGDALVNAELTDGKRDIMLFASNGKGGKRSGA